MREKVNSNDGFLSSMGLGISSWVFKPDFNTNYVGVFFRLTLRVSSLIRLLFIFLLNDSIFLLIISNILPFSLIMCLSIEWSERNSEKVKKVLRSIVMTRWTEQTIFWTFQFWLFLLIHRFLLIICHLFVVATIVAESFDFKCEVQINAWMLFGNLEECSAQNVNITSQNEVITSVNGSTEPTNLQYLDFYNQNVHYLPKGINKFFPNLKGLAVTYSKLKSLTQDDLKSLTQLEIVDFSANDLVTLDGDLFEFNPKLKYVNFGHNKLKYVDDSLLNHLNDLQRSYFYANPCINAETRSSSEIPALIQKLKSQCKRPSETKLI